MSKTLIDDMSLEIARKDEILALYIRNEDKTQLVLDGILIEQNLQTNISGKNKQSQTMLAFGINQLEMLNKLDGDLKE